MFSGPSLDYISRVSDRLYISGALNRALLEEASIMGISHVISVAKEHNDLPAIRQEPRLPLGFHWCKWEDDAEPKDIDDFLICWEWIQSQERSASLLSRIPPTFLVHCGAGANRAPLMATFMLAMWRRCHPDDAFRVVCERRRYTTSWEYLPNYRTSCIEAVSGVLSPVV